MRNMVKLYSGSIVAGGTITNAIQLNDASAMAITTASYVTATALTFQVSVDGINFYNLYDETSTEVSLTTTASAVRAYRLHPGLISWPWIKIREGTSASPVAQKTRDILFDIVAPVL